jgi:hypothetical protein
VAGWVDGTYFLAIRKISLCADDVDREVIMDLGPDMVSHLCSATSAALNYSKRRIST